MNVRVIAEHVVEGRRLGRHVEHDPRSRAWPVMASATVKLRTVHHRRYGPPLDQGELGSCTGNAAAGCMNTKPLHKVGAHLFTEADAVALYAVASQLDDIDGGYPPDDTGSSGLAVAKALIQRGSITAYRHAFGIDQALAALQTAPLITGVNWYDQMDTPDASGLVVVGGQVRGGHEFQVLGYQAGQVVCENSWGGSWGVNGRFRLTVADWARLLDEEGDATVLLRNPALARPPARPRP